MVWLGLHFAHPTTPITLDHSNHPSFPIPSWTPMLFRFLVAWARLYSSLCPSVGYHFIFLWFSGITAPAQSHATVPSCIRTCFLRNKDYTSGSIIKIWASPPSLVTSDPISSNLGLSIFSSPPAFFPTFFSHFFSHFFSISQPTLRSFPYSTESDLDFYLLRSSQWCRSTYLSGMKSSYWYVNSAGWFMYRSSTVA